MAKITYDTLPEAVEYLIKLVEKLTLDLKHSEKQPQLVKDILNVTEALGYLHELGYKVRLSTIYKSSARGAIPHMKLAKKLVFKRPELEQWVDAQSQIKTKNTINTAIAKAAQNKLNH